MKTRWWAWVIVIATAVLFLLPIVGTFNFSLRINREALSFRAYEIVLSDGLFLNAFGFSLLQALITITVSLLLVVPTAFWVHLKVPAARPILEFISLMPFVIPAIVLVFGLIRTFGRPPLLMTNSVFTTDILLVAGYVVLTLPYMYRAVDAGLRAMNVRALTEAAQSLGAGWPAILARVIFPNLRPALISGALLTFATVIGELILASFLARPAFGPYMATLGQTRAFEPAALAIMSYALTWMALALIDAFARGGERQTAAVR